MLSGAVERAVIDRKVDDAARPRRIVRRVVVRHRVQRRLPLRRRRRRPGRRQGEQPARRVVARRDVAVGGRVGTAERQHVLGRLKARPDLNLRRRQRRVVGSR